MRGAGEEGGREGGRKFQPQARSDEHVLARAAPLLTAALCYDLLLHCRQRAAAHQEAGLQCHPAYGRPGGLRVSAVRKPML